jgi:hypothetical protein
MKKLSIPFFLFLITMLSSCELIGGIFKAGAITGIIAVVVVVALIFWVIAKIAG